MAFENLGEAVYGVDLTGPHIWNKKLDIKAALDAAITTVQVRRIGDLHFRITDMAGGPRAGIPVELTSLEFDTTAEAWIQAGKLKTLPASTTTDADGSLMFPAIPNGKYQWRVISSTGEPVGGIVELPALGQELVPVVLL